MSLSVVVPLYNKAKYIRRCLDSIATQTLSGFEAIVVDDGSTDGGAALAEAYPDSRFRVIRQANAGPGAARNRGISEARGDYIAFLDADDAWRPRFLETNRDCLERHPEALCVTGGCIYHPQGDTSRSRWSRRGIVEGLFRVSPATPPRLFVSLVSYMTPSMTMARAAALRRWSGFHEGGCRFAEDSPLWVKFLLNGQTYIHLEPLTEFHTESSELSRNYAGPRPVEPFLRDPRPLVEACPAELRPLLDNFFAARVCKTACMLAYWGDSRGARALVRRFLGPRDWRTPLFAAALLGATPFGGLAGSAWRKLGIRQPSKVRRASAQAAEASR